MSLSPCFLKKSGLSKKSITIGGYFFKMKLTNRTTPQAKNYQCDKCKYIFAHVDMYDDNFCYDCYKLDDEKEKAEEVKD